MIVGPQTNHQWECYMGSIFERIIKNYPLHTYKNVVEFAPGYRYKIGYALSKINFEGNLYVIDSNVDVIKYIVAKYKQLLPKANIIGINKCFKEALNDIPKNIDLFLSNHSIDDMIIGKYLTVEEANSIFNDEIDSKDRLLFKWEELSQNNHILNDIKQDVIDEWKLLFRTKHINLVIISQYKSNSYFDDETYAMDLIIKDVFEEIKKFIPTNHKFLSNILNFYVIEDDERFKDMKLLNNTQNANNWIVGLNINNLYN